MSAELKIGFLGAGKMATALARGFIKAGLVNSGNILGSDPYPAARQAFSVETGAHSSDSNQQVVKECPVLVLAVKPDQVTSVLKEINAGFTGHHLLISIAAGATISKLEGGLPMGSRVIRVMPNTPAMVGASATAYALGTTATKEDGELCTKLFSSVGISYAVKEALLDAVTGLSGSGPAYVYVMIEALSDGGVAAGLPRDVATRLAAQTVFGSAKMVIETGIHPGALKDMVTSPGGTTIEGLHELEKGGVRAAFINAVRAASEKSRKLGQG